MLKTEDIKLPAITIKRGALGTIEILGQPVEIPPEDVTIQPDLNIGSKAVTVDMASFYNALKVHELTLGIKPPEILEFTFPGGSPKPEVKSPASEQKGR